MENLHALLEGATGDNSNNIGSLSELIIESSNLEIELLQEGVVGNIIEAIKKLFRRFWDFLKKLFKRTKNINSDLNSQFNKVKDVAKSYKDGKTVTVDQVYDFSSLPCKGEVFTNLNKNIENSFLDSLFDGLTGEMTAEEMKKHMVEEFDKNNKYNMLKLSEEGKSFEEIFPIKRETVEFGEKELGHISDFTNKCLKSFKFFYDMEKRMRKKEEKALKKAQKQEKGVLDAVKATLSFSNTIVKFAISTLMTVINNNLKILKKAKDNLKEEK